MQPAFLRELRALLPQPEPFLYFDDRESPWLLARLMEGPQKLAELRKTPAGGLLGRPLLKALLAKLGDGRLHPEDLAPLADPMAALTTPAAGQAPGAGGAGARAAATLAGAADWRAYTVTLAEWGADGALGPWQALQLSRAGGNLVLQLNFPDAHQAAFARRLKPGLRKALEVTHHPVRRSGPITMAWARLDMEPWGEDLLIEELQSDWFRMVRGRRAYLLEQKPDSHELAALNHYERTVLRRYERDWDRALMLAVLCLAKDELGIRRVWLPQPQTGAALKHISGALPPRSLYTALPKRFLFRPVMGVPGFLGRRERTFKRLRRAGDPLFWRLDL